jgi:copper chaperone CopZ
VSKGLKKLDGAEKVDVSLEQGLAKIQLKPENKVTLAAIQKIIKRNGFLPKRANVKLRGKLQNHTLTITGSNESLPARLNQTHSVDPQKEYWVEGTLKIEDNGTQSLAISVLKE